MTVVSQAAAPEWMPPSVECLHCIAAVAAMVNDFE